MRILNVLLILFIGQTFSIQAQGDDIPTSGYPELEMYNSWIEKEAVDSAYYKRLNRLKNIHPDTLFYLYATKDFEEIFEEVFFYHEEYIRNKTYDVILKEVEKIEKAAKQYNSRPLMLEAEMIRATYLPCEDDKELKYKEEQILNVIRKAEKSGNDYIKFRALIDLWLDSFYSERYAKSFYYAGILADEIEKNDRVKLLKNGCYFRIAQTYYNFRDYDRAFHYLKKVLEHPSDAFCDNYHVMACNYLAGYYHIHNKPDSIDYYYRSILESPPLYRGVEQKAVAIANLGHRAFDKKEYDKSIALLKAGRDVMLADNDYGFVARIDIGLGNAYLAKGDYEKTWEMIESARQLGIMHSFDSRRQKLYSLLSKYYTFTGDAQLASLYQDSAVVAVQEYEKEYTSLYVAKGEKLIFERESDVKNKEIRWQKRQIYYSLIIVLVLSVAFVVVLIYYRRTRKAYRALVKKSREWALSPSGEVKDVTLESISAGNAVSEEKNIMMYVLQYVVKDEGFKNTELTLNSLSEKLNINRTYLSKTLNNVTGKNFNVWLNEYRIKEAIRIMSDPGVRKLSMDDLAYKTGFNSRATFYRSFKKVTEISPSNFKNNQETQI